MFDLAIEELQWSKYADMHRDTSDEQLIDVSALYAEEAPGNTASSPEINNALTGAYNSISSRALVEISKQLKRIADHLDEKK